MKINAKVDISKWNGPQLVQRARFVFGKYCTEVFPKFKESIDAAVYEWPNVTIRQNKQVVTSPRNIVDTGAFKQSQERAMLNATTCLFTWNTPYSSLILTGYVTKTGQRLPGRDWISPVLQTEFPMARYFEQEWKRLGY